MEYLQDKHGEQYVGTDDMMPEDFEDWLQDQDPLDLVEYAEMWRVSNKKLTRLIDRLILAVDMSGETAVESGLDSIISSSIPL